MDKKRLEYYKKKLSTRREELLKSIARTEEEGRQADDDPTVDLADKAANSYTKEFLFGVTNTDRVLLNQIDVALKRIDEEEYGVCANCEEEMQQKRLEAVPWAKHCINCQEKAEKGKSKKDYWFNAHGRPLGSHMSYTTYRSYSSQQPVKVVALVGASPIRRNWTVHDGTARCLSPRKVARGISSPGIEPMGLNEDEPHQMSLVRRNNRRRPIPGEWMKADAGSVDLERPLCRRHHRLQRRQVEYRHRLQRPGERGAAVRDDHIAQARWSDRRRPSRLQLARRRGAARRRRGRPELLGPARKAQCRVPRRRLQSRQFEPDGVGTIELRLDEAARIGGRIGEITRGAAARAKSETIERHQRASRIAGH